MEETAMAAVDELAMRNWSADVQWVRKLVQQRLYHRNCRSPEWLGIPIAARFHLDLSNRRGHFLVQEIIYDWLSRGVLGQQCRRDPLTGRLRRYLVTK